MEARKMLYLVLFYDLFLKWNFQPTFLEVVNIKRGISITKNVDQSDFKRVPPKKLHLLKDILERDSPSIFLKNPKTFLDKK